ncbi:MAG: TorF family putative porin [Pseudolabrys sp.]
MRSTDLHRARAVVVAITTWAISVAVGPAHGQTPAEISGGMIGLGGRGWSPAEGTLTSDHPANQFGFDARAGFATDYMYRGTTLSDHKPAVGAAMEATFAQLYAGVSVASVKLPTQPAAEIAVSGGVRPKIGDIDFDLRMTYYLYPGEVGTTNGIDYWEAGIRADKQITESIRVAGAFAYSPNVSNTGAWSWYAAAGLGYGLPSGLLPADISVSFTGGAGYSWFGNQSQELGGFPLPAYLNWQAGVTFTRKVFNLDLRYYDTNLSKENCFVFTGDPNARPGGSIDPVTNPEGLTSRWCSATFVAKVWFALN